MNILVVIKQSKYEWESLSAGITGDELIRTYSSEHANLNAIMHSHAEQLIARDAMRAAFPDATFCFMTDKLDFIPAAFEMIFVLGGDNSFTKVSHYINAAPVLGINSDPQRSSGHLLNWAINKPQDAYALRSIIDDGDYTIEDWTRLAATVNGKPVIAATSEYFLGERFRDKMSRHVLEYRGKSCEQKCSGLLVATGIGSTGWFKSVVGLGWSKNEKIAMFGATELFESDLELQKKFDYYAAYELLPDEELVVHSLNDDDGCISVDAWDRYDFHRGSTARITIGSPLRVIVPNKEISK